MKHIIKLAALAVIALASCTKNDIDPSAKDRQEIQFDTPVMSLATKSATETAGNFPTDQVFNVYAHYYPGLYTSFNEGATYMNNVTVTYNADKGTNGSWVSASDKYYWPNEGTLTFAAYSPIEGIGTVSYDESGFSFDGFTVKDNPDDQIDLLFSERSYNMTKTSQKDLDPYYYGVQINFLHALSSILFKVKVDEILVGEDSPQYEFKIKKLELLNVYNTGNFNQNLPITGINQVTPAASANDWICDTSSETDYVIFEGEKVLNTADPVTMAGNQANATSLILMPQSLKHNENNVTVRVTYDLRHAQMNPGEYLTGNVATAQLSTNTVSGWLRGKRYIYTLTIGRNEIKFSPKVETWVSEPNINI